MPEEESIKSVNRHYLDKVMDLADEKDIKASEDIYDACGMKLVAKGARISRGLQEKLIMRRLRKPFESSVTVEGGVDIHGVIAEAERIAETIEPVACILGTVKGAGPTPLQVLAGSRFGNAMSMMLTIIEGAGASALTHSVMVSLLSICLARKMRLGQNEQGMVAIAGLLHDIGELYIDPEYLHSRRRLHPHEWRHVVIHPRIGQMLIEELENYPPAVARAVFEHHERLNGAGYPRQVSGSAISVAGQVVSVAEMISGVFLNKDKPLERAELALKIIPGEHGYDMVSAVSCAMRNVRADREESGGHGSGEETESVRALYKRIAATLEAGEQLTELPVLKAQKPHQLLTDVLRRTRVVQRAFSSVGLDLCLAEAGEFLETRNTAVLFEVAVSIREIEWRMRDIARDLSLHAAALAPDEAQAFQPLIALLDGDRQAFQTPPG